MSAAAGFYMPGDSWLYRLDPRAKLWLACLGIGLCFVTGRIELLVAVLALGQITLLAGGVTAGSLGLVWRRLGLLLVLILVLQPIFSSGTGAPLFSLGPVTITQTGLLTGVRYALRVASAAFFALIPIMTTPINQLVRGMQKLGLPYLWGTTIGLALRYLGTIGDLYTHITEAQRARGWDPTEGNLIQQAKSAVPALIALVIASLRLSDSLALGMAARGFGLKRQRTWREDIAMSGLDWAAVAISGVVFAVMLGLLTGA